ncbi:substrate-binding periplasmic protein [Streptomyces sp. TRM68416]|uniref:substrate-binding periplasmic protein n=1 Tax=Streptomyces sp. TRM68416 TaxID=2758412 RepID=UPI001661B6F5|nr:transporter substrate-binding domain-containing protein [Streptomyces sp. TRM68416]MBD0843957.1 amino acid ABC transporter substrate-binding protein [Streptomyces sp. TRM68416]
MAAVSLLAVATLSGCGGDSSTTTVAADCKPQHEFKTLTDGTLTVVSFDLPPFSKVQGNDITGVDGDIVKAIAKMECLTVTVKAAGAAAVIPTAQAGRADLAAGDWYRTAERAKVLDLSDPLYLDDMGLVSEEGVTAIPDLKSKGYTVGTVEGYLWVADLKDYLGGKLKTYPSGVNCYQDLEAGRVDVCVDAYGGAVYATKGKDLKVEKAEPFDKVAASIEAAQATFPMPKGHEDMLKAVNEDIAALRSSGELAKILTKNGLEAGAAEVGEPRLIG